jgi:hypothetical protein
MPSRDQQIPQQECLMKSKSLNTPWQRSSVWARGLALVSLAAGAWALSAGAAHARSGSDVYWSIGINQPGVSVGVSNAPPVIYREPRVVYREPVVVYREPVVVYREPRVVYQRPAPVVYQSWGHPRFDDRRAYKKHKRDKWHRHHSRGWDDDDGYRRGGRGRD